MEAVAGTDAAAFLTYVESKHLPGLTSSDPTDSPFLPIPIQTMPPAVPGHIDVLPERTGVDYGSQSSFKVGMDPHNVLKKITLWWRSDNLNAAGGGANARYGEDMACQGVDNVSWQVNGVIQHTFTGDSLHIRLVTETDEEEYRRLCVLQRHGLTAAERANLANVALNPGGIWCGLEIPFWWTESSSNAYHHYTLPTDTRLIVNWRNIREVLQQDGVNAQPTANLGGNYILDQFCRLDISALDYNVRKTFQENVKQNGESGIHYVLIYDQIQENEVINVGTTQYTFNLTNMNKPTSRFILTFRPTANTTPDYTNNRRFEYQPLPAASTIDLIGSTKRMCITSTDLFLKYSRNGALLPGNPAENIYQFYFTDVPLSYDMPPMSIDMFNVQNPHFRFTFGAATPANWRADCYAKCTNLSRTVIRQNNQSGIQNEQPI